MYNFLIRKGQSVALIFGLICVAIFLGSAMSGLSSAGYDIGTDLNSLSDEAKAGISFFNPGLKLTLGLVIVALVLALVVFGVVDLIKFPKGAIRVLAGVAVIGIIFFALYSMSDVETAGKLGELHQRFNISDSISKMISGGLKTTLGLAVIAVVAMIIFELYNAFK